eukprot:TRINITY_DN2901_c0_g1_i3.p1 TRINITY_DN2901_c0_g1~~TRINITY_DN2901_c0_g1_i3.p1  ORF type:complete len:174 (+),score=33.04 TRINITY_DN2901_c0_g1_i3:112-633(+)
MHSSFQRPRPAPRNAMPGFGSGQPSQPRAAYQPSSQFAAPPPIQMNNDFDDPSLTGSIGQSSLPRSVSQESQSNRLPAPGAQQQQVGGGIADLSKFVMGNPTATQAMINTLAPNLMPDINQRFSWFSWNYFRYYFRVNNGYVFNKMKLLFFPYLHPSWVRAEVSQDFFQQQFE